VLGRLQPRPLTPSRPSRLKGRGAVESSAPRHGATLSAARHPNTTHSHQAHESNSGIPKNQRGCQLTDSNTSTSLASALSAALLCVRSSPS
jgi:hypothetical protein